MTEYDKPATLPGRRGRPSADDIRDRMAALLVVARHEFGRIGYRNATMANIARAAGLTKRTLYLWHENKATLFRACILEGVSRFPKIDADSGDAPSVVLERFLADLIDELARDDASSMGRLLVREGAEFPELGPVAERSHNDFIIAPLSAYLRSHKLEREESVEMSELLVSMALAPVHNGLLLGRAMPSPSQARDHARFVVTFFMARVPDRPAMVGAHSNDHVTG